jgi:hypothetical protein
MCDFIPDGFNKKLLDLPLKQLGMNDNKEDPALSEWVVGIKWQKTFERDDATRFQGIFANPCVYCVIRRRSIFSAGIAASHLESVDPECGVP